MFALICISGVKALGSLNRITVAFVWRHKCMTFLISDQTNNRPKTTQIDCRANPKALKLHMVTNRQPLQGKGTYCISSTRKLRGWKPAIYIIADCN